jgi:cystathionine gamma-lyase
MAPASGMLTIATVLEILDANDHVVAMDDRHGGTYRLYENVRKRSAGLEFSFADLGDSAQLAASLQPNTKMI